MANIPFSDEICDHVLPLITDVHFVNELVRDLYKLFKVSRCSFLAYILFSKCLYVLLFLYLLSLILNLEELTMYLSIYVNNSRSSFQNVQPQTFGERASA